MSTDPVKKAIDPVNQDRCADCPPDRVCAWDCAQGQGVLEAMMGEALAEQAQLKRQLEPEVESIEQSLYEIYT